MSSKLNVDHMAHAIASMSREDVKRELLHFRGRFDLDFSEDFLEGLPVDRLRHILFAAKVQQGRVN